MAFKIGDRVRIRAWDDMSREFGEDEDGIANHAPYFVKGMKYLCGEEATIADIDGNYVILNFQVDDDWYFSVEMLEPVEENKTKKG